MSGSRVLAFGLKSSLQSTGRVKIFPSLTSSIRAPKEHNAFLVGGSLIRSFSRFTPRTLERKSPRYSSTILAGVLGSAGVTLIHKDSFTNPFSTFFISITTVYCADDDDKCRERKCDSTDCLRNNEREEEMIKKANSELEKALADTKGKVIELTEAALKAYCEAIAALKLAMNKVHCAVEEENLESSRFEEVWCDVNEALKRRCELVSEATEKGECAWALLRRLREVIENGRACKYTTCNPLLNTSENTLNCAEKEMCAKEKVMDKLLRESRTSEQFRNVVEEFRRDLKAESESLLASDDCLVTFNKNEANMILTHAYKTILRVQQEALSQQRGKGGKNC